MILHPRAPEGICPRHNDRFSFGEWQFCYTDGQKSNETIVYTAHQDWQRGKLHLSKSCSGMVAAKGHLIETKALFRMPRERMCLTCMSSNSVTPLSADCVRDLTATRTNKHGQHDHAIAPVRPSPMHPNQIHMRRPDSDFTDEDLARRQRTLQRIHAERYTRELKIAHRFRRLRDLGVVNPNVFQPDGQLVHINTLRERPGQIRYRFEGEHYNWTTNTPTLNPRAPRRVESIYGRYVFNGHRIWPDDLLGDFDPAYAQLGRPPIQANARPYHPV